MKPFEPLKSFELAKQIESQTMSINGSSKTEIGSLPADYKPVEPLSPLKPFELDPPSLEQNEPKYTNGTHSEIKEEKIKNTLKEIISDLDTYAEKDKELKESVKEQIVTENGKSDSYSYEKTIESQTFMKEVCLGDEIKLIVAFTIFLFKFVVNALRLKLDCECNVGLNVVNLSLFCCGCM